MSISIIISGNYTLSLQVKKVRNLLYNSKSKTNTKINILELRNNILMFDYWTNLDNWTGSEIRQAETQCLILLARSIKTCRIQLAWWFSRQIKKRIFLKIFRTVTPQYIQVYLRNTWVHPRFLVGFALFNS